eukprot:GHVH01002228.1.p1 GENE.GHVH01002228.1~~GHVH01002228.1.p1  ORF type:complete len:399 (+),score=26.88 GHVH01002228.1:587-1783(+)
MVMFTRISNNFFPFVQVVLYHLNGYVTIDSNSYPLSVPITRIILGIASCIFQFQYLGKLEIIVGEKGRIIPTLGRSSNASSLALITQTIKKFGGGPTIFILFSSIENRRPFFTMYPKRLYHHEGRLVEIICEGVGAFIGGLAVWVQTICFKDMISKWYWRAIQLGITLQAVSFFIMFVSFHVLPISNVDKDNLPDELRTYALGYEGEARYRLNSFTSFEVAEYSNGCLALQRMHVFSIDNPSVCQSQLGCIPNTFTCVDQRYHGRMQTGFVSSIRIPNLVDPTEFSTYTSTTVAWIPLIAGMMSGVVNSVEIITLFLFLVAGADGTWEDASSRTALFLILPHGAECLFYILDTVPSFKYQYQFYLSTIFSLIGFISLSIHFTRESIWDNKTRLYNKTV